MPNFLAFINAGISAPSSNSMQDGKDLARGCIERLEKLENSEQFPPRLLILLTSPSFLNDDKAQQLITGIYRGFKEVYGEEIPLIGSSVAAVFYNNQIYGEGALLTCLASRMIEAEVAVAPNASQNVEEAPSSIVAALHLNSLVNQHTSPLPHRLLLTFLPGSGRSDIEARQLTERLHANLWRGVYHQIRIAGGVSSANDPKRGKQGMQFANRAVYKDAVATALIKSGVPLNENLTNGVDWKENEELRVEKLSDDGLTIKRFDSGPPDEVLRNKGKLVLFKQAGRGGDRVMAVSDNRSSPRKVHVLRELSIGRVLSPGEPTSTVMYRSARKAIKESKESMRIANPTGCFSIKCTSHYMEREFLDLPIEQGIARMSKEMLNDRPYVGGFFDGEIGMDKTGRSACGNWGVATVVFGDEMSDSTLMQRGYAAMNTHSAALSGAFDLDEVLSKSVDLIWEIGFPGAMISFLLPEHHKTYILAQKTKGPRFDKIKDLTKLDLEGTDVLARIARDKVDEPHFIADSSEDDECDQDTIRESGIISQCIIRLKSADNDTLGLLQVDFGDARYKSSVYGEEKKMLELIAAFIAANLNRSFIWNENEIANKLDKALVESLSANSIDEGLQNFIEKATDAFSLTMGHVRLVNQDKTDFVLRAGVGEYYEAAKKLRLQIDRFDQSPTIDAVNDKEGRPNVINLALENEGHRSLRRRYSGDPEMSAALRQVESYANIPFKKSGETIGTINLISSRRWFFKHYHARAFNALAQRVNVLVEHLTSKQNEKLLRNVTPNLANIRDFHDTTDVLERETARFSQAFGAEYAALYLWDEDSSLYILRSEYRWDSADWVGRAFYKKDEGWIGNIAANADRPEYVKDLYAEYKELGYSKDTKRYAKEIFGQDLSETFTAEALALPLIVGRQSLGVLTLYRKLPDPEKRQPSGFTTTEPDLLLRATNPFAGLVKIATDHQETMWDDLEKGKHGIVYDGLPSQEARDFEARICKQWLRPSSGIEVDSLPVIQADFYRLDEYKKPVWATGYRVDKVGKLLKTPWPSSEQKMMVEEAAEAEKTIAAPVIAEGNKAYIGRLERACIPLLATGSLVGVLDVYWDIAEKQEPPLIGERGKNYLSGLGKMIGSAYNRHNVTLISRKSRLALQGLTQGIRSSHTLSHEIADLKGWAAELQNPTGKNMQRWIAERISRAVTSIDKLFQNKVELFRDVVEGKEQPLDVEDVIERVFTEYFSKDEKDGNGYPRSVDFSQKLCATGVPGPFREVFKMLFENAYRSMRRGGSKEPLIIQGGLDEDEGEMVVRVFIKDSGEGIREDIKKRLPEISEGHLQFNQDEGRYMFGLYYSYALIQIMGGTLRLENNPDGGALAEITLPFTETEDRT